MLKSQKATRSFLPRLISRNLRWAFMATSALVLPEFLKNPVIEPETSRKSSLVLVSTYFFSSLIIGIKGSAIAKRSAAKGITKKILGKAKKSPAQIPRQLSGEIKCPESFWEYLLQPSNRQAKVHSNLNKISPASTNPTFNASPASEYLIWLKSVSVKLSQALLKTSKISSTGANFSIACFRPLQIWTRKKRQICYATSNF